MRDASNLFTSEEGVIVGHIETDTGTILLTDGLWRDQLPSTSQSRVAIDLGVERCRIPVFAAFRNDKRFLIIAIDDAEFRSAGDENVETEDQVPVPENKDEQELGEDDNG